MLVLGIETSCDETAAAIVSDRKEVLANMVLSQTDEHLPYGGVVPEIAARAHMEHLETIIAKALGKAKLTFADLDAVAVTGGPGLIGGVIVGVMMAKAIASVHEKPLVAVNHLEGHALTARLCGDVPFPFLLLLVSGGHCQFLAVENVGHYRRYGGTIDDALGEAFDKTAKMLGLGYPGGPAVEKLAKEGNPQAYSFTVPMKGRPGCDFSFSGLKTAVRTQLLALSQADEINAQQKADLCASFQEAVAQSVCDRAQNAIERYKQECPQARHFVLAGGVAANQFIRARLETICVQHGLELVAPPVALCTDNAAMIAWAGIERLKAGFVDGFDFEPRARWPLASKA